jgi:hypothetical protein
VERQVSNDRVASLPRPSLAVALVAAAAAAFVLLLPSAHAKPASIVWVAPTSADRTHFDVTVGKKFSLSLTASTSTRDAFVLIQPLVGLPKGAVLDAKTRGGVARATFRWTPAELGRYTFRFGATGESGHAPVLTYVIEVGANVHYPRSYSLIDRKTAHWAMVLKRVGVHAQPTLSSRLVTTLELTTPDKTQNLVAVLAGLDRSATETWYRVRLPILPNNSTGWVPASALGKLAEVHTHLYVDKRKLTATLEVDGKPVFETLIGVGQAKWPTPRGNFYIRSKLTNFNDPFYGPVAIATSARSAVLTDWPGGGFVGVHGTSLPQLLPGQVSHGCIRMPNASILKLARLMQVGTPLTVR